MLAWHDDRQEKPTDGWKEGPQQVMMVVGETEKIRI
jgi:hypothetical protein